MAPNQQLEFLISALLGFLSQAELTSLQERAWALSHKGRPRMGKQELRAAPWTMLILPLILSQRTIDFLLLFVAGEGDGRFLSVISNKAMLTLLCH